MTPAPATNDGNDALFFRSWDRLLGAEVPEHEQKFVERGGAATVGGS